MKDPTPLMFHAEVVFRDGVPVGYVRAASYGHTLGGAIGLAMIAVERVMVQGIDEVRWSRFALKEGAAARLLGLVH